MRNLVITLDFGTIPEWAITAKKRQISDWIEANKGKLPFDNLILLPSQGESKLYWLEGNVKNEKDITEIASLRDKLKPILEVALGLKADSGEYTNPLKKAMIELAAHRAKKKT